MHFVVSYIQYAISDVYYMCTKPYTYVCAVCYQPNFI